MKYLKNVLIVFFLFGIFCIPFQKSFVIEKENTGKILAYFPIQQTNKTFHILYTHSIHKSDVKETYNILNNGTIRLIEITYEDTSIGMPSNAEEGEIFEMIDGKYVISNMKRDFQSISMRVAQVVGDHTIIVNGHQMHFSQVVAPGSLVKLKVKRLSLWQLWRGVNIVGKST
ncbi:DUF1850 domain-containing protein [Lederbergia wuyishanensis]|uniref:DUF1850 domain-containing protein n=1 Tax=Lederbergia wuyishanensis TaxID=1347903 RepID=A0ABU0CZ27_9BACI|nr:DUF1850 domain-containing protein [Lederbergia wuyishanensis]MCJ8006029.1 DUF1850 domain-containing protein [Lederbergia wuyishanensis]MDQ0341396.1 hypothetical protein [Lederbergia wuyishanensis]